MYNNKIDEIMESLVKITVTELETALNKSYLISNYKTDSLIGKLIAQSVGKYKIDWSNDIIRDEVFATFYESMLIIAEANSLKEEQINLDNPAFIGASYNMAILRLKKFLIPISRQTSDKEIANKWEMAISQLGLNINGKELTIEDILNAKTYESFNIKESHNHFANWFFKNKDNILTKKQLEFVEGNVKHKDPDKARTMRRRIEKRVLKAYDDKYDKCTFREAELKDMKGSIENILESDDFRAALMEKGNELYIIDAIMDHVSIEATKAFNKGSNDEKIIREYRIALFKALNKINNQLENI